jgi:hypothetical protein
VQTNPPGGCIFIDGAPVRTGFGPFSVAYVSLPPGNYAIGADPAIFTSWAAGGGLSVDSATANPAKLTVSGSGQLTLNATALISYVSYDFWSAGVVGAEVNLQLPDAPTRVDGVYVSWGADFTVTNTNPIYTYGGGGDFVASDLRPITVVLKVPAGFMLQNDPTVLVDWEITRQDTGQPIVKQTVPVALGGPAYLVTIDHSSASLQAVGQFSVECRLYRVLASGATSDIFRSGTVQIQITDWYDRGHPYMQFLPKRVPIYPGRIFWDAIAFDPRQPSLPSNPRWLRSRARYRIHRTDIWTGGQRCLVASNLHASGKRVARDGVVLPEQQAHFDDLYLDTLPVSLAQIEEDRSTASVVLCDYCFFGGPTKSALRRDFPTQSGLPPV